MKKIIRKAILVLKLPLLSIFIRRNRFRGGGSKKIGL
jgi:hypothetical protein